MSVENSEPGPMNPARLPTFRQSIEFTGQAREYFGIWITNVLLSLATVGIYSAWAKVRRLTYFYNKTRIHDCPFGYHATGLQILKGRVIAVAILVTFNVISVFSPLATIIFALAFAAVTPLLMNMSMKFSARMTSFRNIRFDWHGTYGKSFLFFMIGPLLGFVSLGLLTPLMSKYFYRYYATGHSYGVTRFSADPPTSNFYFAFLVGALLPGMLLGILTGAGYLIYLSFAVGVPVWMVWDASHGGILIVLAFGFLTGFLFSFAFIFNVLCRNLLVSALTLPDAATFSSRINLFRFIWISLSNLFLAIVSLGLMIPWCQIRMYRYLCDCTSLSATGDLDEFVDSERKKRSAFGEEIAEFEGLDVSI
ncbi:MAG: DUF898 domain-containing protein [Gammaproteobacteria bacterium]|nr:DUF898 domain-containing protein [Gammaproteobacteria bacterium]MYJ51776.1 DUF898 domain-containing protein [Gammaproteobacteria bacterium]